MIINQVEIEGYRSYGKKQVINLSSPGLVLLTGENRDRGISSGAGKSSIFKAICCALFEENDDSSIKDSAINRLYPKGMCIGVHFSNHDKTYYVSYSRNHHEMGTDWKIWRLDTSAGKASWRDIRESRLNETKQVIQDIIGMNYEQFTNVAYLEQQKVADFIWRTDKDRRRIFSHVLGLDSCDQYVENARSLRKDKENKLREGTGKLSALNSQLEIIQSSTISDGRVSELRNKLGFLNGSTEEINRKISENQELLSKVEDIVELTTRLRIIDDRRKELLNKIKPDLILVDRTVLHERVAKLKEMLSDLNARLSDKLARINIMAERHEKVSGLGTSCIECEQEITKAQKMTLARKYSEALDDLKKDLGPLRQAKADVEYDLSRTETSLIEYETEKANNSEYLTLLTESKTIAKKIKVIKEVLGDTVNIAEGIRHESNELQKELFSINSEVQRVNLEIAKGEMDKKRINDLRLSIEGVVKENETLEREVNLFRRCEELIGDKGFKNYKMRSSCATFNNHMSGYLGILTDGEISAELVTEVLKADGKSMKSELDIIVKDGNKEKIPLRHYSGGEQTNLSLAITGAFSELSGEQFGNGVNLLLLDEPFGMMDAWGEERACVLLSYMRQSMGKTILVVTNRQGIRERGVFDREIRAVKENYMTHVEEYDLSGDH